MNTYVVKYQVIDKDQPHFKFVGWPYKYAVVHAENSGYAHMMIENDLPKIMRGNRLEIRINTVIEANDPITILPITIEENTVVDIREKQTDTWRKETSKIWSVGELKE